MERERVIEIRNFEALQRAEKAETEIRKLRMELANLTGITNPEGLRQ